MSMPSRVRVGFRTYRVLRMPKDWERDDAGQHSSDTQRIRYRKISPVEDVGTVFHEIGHGGWEMSGLGRAAEEEQAVTVLTNCFITALVDNPELLEHLYQTLRKDEGH